MTSVKGIVKEITAEQVIEAATYAWAVYQDETKRTTPPYHTLEQMIAQYEKNVGSKYLRLLGYFENDQLEGVLSLDIDDENRYVGSAGGLYIARAEAYTVIADVFMAYLEAHCKGYVCYFGTTKPNVNSQKHLEAKGFVCTEDTIQMRVEPSCLNAVKGSYVVQALTEADYDQYRAFHTEHFSEYQWTADKIFNVIDRWHVYIVKIEGIVVGNVFSMRQTATSGEIYGATVLPHYEKTDMLSQLYYESTAPWFEKGLKEIVNFVPEGHMLDAASRVGFVGYDTYMCYFQKELFV